MPDLVCIVGFDVQLPEVAPSIFAADVFRMADHLKHALAVLSRAFRTRADPLELGVGEEPADVEAHAVSVRKIGPKLWVRTE